jgi:chromosome segregation ATPase
MGRLLGVRQVEMMVSMVGDWYRPVFDALERRTLGLDEMIEVQAKKNLGIYDLLAERAALQEKISSIEERTQEFTTKVYRGDGWSSRLEEEEKFIKRNLQPIEEKIANMKKEHIDTIKMASADGEFIEFMQQMKKDIEALAVEVKELPPIDETVVNALSES